MRLGRVAFILVSVGVVVLIAVMASLMSLGMAMPGAAAGAAGIARIKLDPAVGPPTTKVKIRGIGFGPGEQVLITFDGTKVGTATTNSSGGGFSTRVKVPRSAVPGDHTVTATGQSSGRSAFQTFLVRTDWAKFQFDASNSGFNPYENVLNPSNVSGLTERWSFGSGNSDDAAPTIADGVVYVGDSQSVYALDASTGVQLWKFGAAGGPPTVENGMVYVGSGDGSVYALDASTGAQLWSFTTGYPVDTSPAVVDGVVYLSSGLVYALDASTGTKLWSFSGTGLGYSSPAVANGVVFVGGGGDDVYALDAATGAKLWSFATGGTPASPAVVNGVVYAPSGGTVYALDASTGAQLWSSGDDENSTPSVANGLVYVENSDNVSALDASTGAQLWSSDPYPGFFVGCCGSPIVANGVVYVTGTILCENADLFALDASTGEQLGGWNLENGWGAFSAVANGIAYTGSYSYMCEGGGYELEAFGL